jgi:DNA transformation protein
MSELSNLPNMGKVLEQLLIEVGITTPEQFRELEYKETFIRIRTKDPTTLKARFHCV